METLEKELYAKLKKGSSEVFSDEECEWITYFESLKSRSDSEHDKGKDPLVGALIRDKDGHILDISHRASGQEGNHAEYILFKEKRPGHDFTDCVLFTTLEPCVDAVRSENGKSCSSIICKSEIKEVHIGILDPNNEVFSIGIATLFENGISVHRYKNSEIIELIYNSCDAFKNPTKDEVPKVDRFMKKVFPLFDVESAELYLRDMCMHLGLSVDEFDFEKEIRKFALKLIRKGLVSFNASKVMVDDSIKILFYKDEYLPGSLNRQIKIINTNDKIDVLPITLNRPLPFVFHQIENIFSRLLKSDSLKEAFREIIANMMIHRSYDVNSSLGYIEHNQLTIVVRNQASNNILSEELKKLPSFKAHSKPGNGIIASFFEEAAYCERSKKGQKTFASLNGKVSINVDDVRNVEVELKII